MPSTLFAAVAVLFLCPPARAGSFDLAPENVQKFNVELGGLLDVRYAHTGVQRSWLLGGPNKLRYGGADIDNNGSGDKSANVLSVPQASLVVDAPLPLDTAVHVQTNLSADTESGGAAVGLIEAYGKFDRSWDTLTVHARAGGFVPAISWEHPGKAWNTEYTLTPSAIGSWIGEEVRTRGAEAGLELGGEALRVRATGAAFSGGDQVGLVLVKRGWAMHDQQSSLTNTLTLPGGKISQPFRELDGRAGYYGRGQASMFNDLLKISGGVWDNDGNINAKSADLTGTLATWRTRFWDAGGKFEYRRYTLIGQFMQGRSESATTSRTYWESWYGLASARFGDWILTGRYDRFMVRQGLERGYAGTGCVQYVLSAQQRIAVEQVYLLSDPNLETRRREIDRLTQLNYRFQFGG